MLSKEDEVLFKKTDDVLYEDDKVAIELGNGERGAAIYVIQKLAEKGTMIRRHYIEDLVGEEGVSDEV